MRERMEKKKHCGKIAAHRHKWLKFSRAYKNGNLGKLSPCYGNRCRQIIQIQSVLVLGFDFASTLFRGKQTASRQHTHQLNEMGHTVNALNDIVFFPFRLSFFPHIHTKCFNWLRNDLSFCAIRSQRRERKKSLIKVNWEKFVKLHHNRKNRTQYLSLLNH